MAEWWQVSWKRVAVALVIVFFAVPALIGAGLWLVSYQLGPIRVARALAEAQPIVNSVPAQLHDLRTGPLHGALVERFGVTLQLPWPEPKNIHDSDAYAFLIGESYIVDLSNPEWESHHLDFLRSVQETQLGPRLDGTEYNEVARSISAHSDQLHWWRLPSENRRIAAQLLQKAWLLRSMTQSTSVYAIHFGGMRGYQIGVPPGSVTLVLFDSRDREYRIDIAKKKGSEALTQPEVNAIVASMRRSL